MWPHLSFTTTRWIRHSFQIFGLVVDWVSGMQTIQFNKNLTKSLQRVANPQQQQLMTAQTITKIFRFFSSSAFYTLQGVFCFGLQYLFTFLFPFCSHFASAYNTCIQYLLPFPPKAQCDSTLQLNDQTAGKYKTFQHCTNQWTVLNLYFCNCICISIFICICAVQQENAEYSDWAKVS